MATLRICETCGTKVPPGTPRRRYETGLLGCPACKGVKEDAYVSKSAIYERVIDPLTQSMRTDPGHRWDVQHGSNPMCRVEGCNALRSQFSHYCDYHGGTGPYMGPAIHGRASLHEQVEAIHELDEAIQNMDKTAKVKFFDERGEEQEADASRGRTVPIERIRKGDIIKPSWGDFPWERAAGDALRDRDHPGDDPHGLAGDPVTMWLVPYGRRFSPHLPKGTPYHKLVASDERTAKQAAKQQDGDETTFGDYTLRYHQGDQGERKPRHVIRAYHKDQPWPRKPVGELNWYGTTGTIHHIDVEPEHARRGLATAMWNWGQTMSPRPKHSADRTTQGDAWARSVGGPLPRRSATSLSKLEDEIKGALTDDLRRAPHKGSQDPLAGHCYVASEAYYHLNGGKDAGLVPMNIQHEGHPHWWVRHPDGRHVDLTAEQFKTPVPYDEGRGRGFLTKQPSKRAQTVIDRVTAKTASVDDLHHVRLPASKVQRGNQYYKAGPSENDPQRRTMCGADPTDKDLGWAQARHKSNHQWITCPDCLDEVKRRLAAKTAADDEHLTNPIDGSKELIRRVTSKVAAIDPDSPEATGNKEEWKPGETAHFEYHCNESHDSPDAPAWYHSHQKATILHANTQDEKDNGVEGMGFADRADVGAPRTYKVKFGDGLKWDAWEDELHTHPKFFTRPDPPTGPPKTAAATDEEHLTNPADGSKEWHHGTSHEFGNFNEERPEEEDDEPEYGYDNPAPHWNTHLGTHWTSIKDVANKFAKGLHGNQRGGDLPKDQGGGVFTAHLGIKNPKVYKSEWDMDAEAFKDAWPHAEAHDPHDSHNAYCHNPNCSGLVEHEAGDEVDKAVRKHYEKGVKGYAALWLSSHPDAAQNAYTFKRKLQKKGHDGIVYGNELEGPHQHPCAIPFDTDQIHHLTKTPYKAARVHGKGELALSHIAAKVPPVAYWLPRDGNPREVIGEHDDKLEGKSLTQHMHETGDVRVRSRGGWGPGSHSQLNVQMVHPLTPAQHRTIVDHAKYHDEMFVDVSSHHPEREWPEESVYSDHGSASDAGKILRRASDNAGSVPSEHTSGLTVTQQRIDDRIASLNLAERFAAEGRSWVDMGTDGQIVYHMAGSTEGHGEEDYMMSHRPGLTGPPIHNLLEPDEHGETMMPDDVYSHPHYYMGDYGKGTKETIQAINEARSKGPEHMVTIHRSSPSPDLNHGDWVTPSHDYARSSGLHPTDASKDLPVHSWKVPAKHVRFAGDDLAEWGYAGPSIKAKTAARELSDEGRVSAAEEVMERSGLAGKQWHIPRLHQDDPDRHEAERPVHEFVHSVLSSHGMTPERASEFRVVPDHWDLRNGGQGVTDGSNYIGVKQHTNDMTLLHECAHVLTHGQEGAGSHGPAFVNMAEKLYHDHISPDAAHTFGNLARPPSKTAGGPWSHKLEDNPYHKTTEWVPLHELKRIREYDRETEPNYPGSTDLDDVTEDMLKNGPREPAMILYGKDDRRAKLGEGNHRIAAAERLGMTHYPARVLRCSHVDDGVSVRGHIEKMTPSGYPEHLPADMKPSDIGLSGVKDNPHTASKTAAKGVYYHVAPAEAREDIRQHGLDHTRGESNNDYEELGQPRGNYLFGSESAAYTHKDMHDRFDDDNGGDHTPWDVWKIHHSGGVTTDPDPNAKKTYRSVFTSEPIHPSKMELLTGSKTVTAADGANRTGVMLALVPDPTVSRSLMKAYDGDNPEPMAEQHITLMYLGKTSDVEEDTLRTFTEQWAKEHEPLTGHVGGFAEFTNDQNVVVALWDIPGIERWVADMKDRLASMGIKPGSDHGYTCHETLGYEDDHEPIPTDIPDDASQDVTFDEIILAYGGSWTRYKLGTGEVIGTRKVGGR